MIADVQCFTHEPKELFEIVAIIDNHHGTEAYFQEDFLHEEACEVVSMDIGAGCDDDKLCHVTHGIEQVSVAIGVCDVTRAP